MLQPIPYTPETQELVNRVIRQATYQLPLDGPDNALWTKIFALGGITNLANAAVAAKLPAIWTWAKEVWGDDLDGLNDDPNGQLGFLKLVGFNGLVKSHLEAQIMAALAKMQSDRLYITGRGY